MGLSHKLMVTPGSKPHLAKRNPGDTPGVSGPRAAAAQLTLHTARLAELQHVMWAENKHSLLVVLQGMDTSGKDGTIRHVFTGVNPQGCRVTSFKVPSAEEADHDFLWRVHAAAPRLGEIGMFNRSHYEDVLVVRVHGLVPKEVWRARYRQINAFERHLTECGTTVLKFYLHISREEQRRRLLARIEDPKKNWKMSEGDLRERERWDDYMEAYEDALRECSTEDAPWFVIPADKKWYRNHAVSRIIVKTLEGLGMKMPRASSDIAKLIVDE